MEYAKDIILNVGYKRVKNSVSRAKRAFIKMEDFFCFIFSILKKGTSIFIDIIKNNKFISISLSILIILIWADLILVSNFMKIFSSLY